MPVVGRRLNDRDCLVVPRDDGSRLEWISGIGPAARFRDSPVRVSCCDAMKSSAGRLTLERVNLDSIRWHRRIPATAR